MRSAASPSSVLPAGVDGDAAPQFRSAVRTFARIFAGRRPGGGALAVYQHGKPVVDIWAGTADRAGNPWTRDTAAIGYSATKGVTAGVIHRLADRGEIDYDAPVAEYWTEFGRRGKSRITVRTLLTHRAGLSSLQGLASGPEEVLDHLLMEERLAAAEPDQLLGVPIYHALTFGWLLAGLARSVTGTGMRELYRTELAEPLGVDGLHLGKPPAEARTSAAGIVGTRLGIVGKPMGERVVLRAAGIPGPTAAAARILHVPGLETILEGEDPPILSTELGAGNGIFTANALARYYSAIAVDGSPLFSQATVEKLRKIQTFKVDRGLFLPMAWHLGYHSFPMPGALGGFGHMGLGGSAGWTDPRHGLAVGFVHNRLDVARLPVDHSLFGLLLPLIVRAARSDASVGADTLAASAGRQTA